MLPFSTILVPKGAEYGAVCRGLRRIDRPPAVVAIPAGPKSASRFLQQWLCNQSADRTPHAVLLMGLCGSLTARLTVADAVLYEMCRAVSGVSIASLTPETNDLAVCDPELTDWIDQRLQGQVERVKGASCDRVICTATEKQQLGQQSGADVVDMEGFAALTDLRQAGIPGTMLRVISDGCDRNLPNLNLALDADGNLKPQTLALAMLQQPGPALQLIQGSLQGLAKLQTLTYQLFG